MSALGGIFDEEAPDSERGSENVIFQQVPNHFSTDATVHPSYGSRYLGNPAVDLDTLQRMIPNDEDIGSRLGVTKLPQVNLLVLYNQHFEISHFLSPVFTGQEEVSQCLESSLALAKLPRQPVQRRFALWGLGGSGKTQICLKYAQVHRERYASC
jgi:hypothetical protein